jgi:type II secretory pathway pseudopilin PulG
MLKNKKTKLNLVCGFTLVEMLVAIAVFMTVMTIAVGSLISIIEANRKAQSIKSVIDNVNFAIETISRDMRISTDYSCSPGPSLYFGGDCPTGGTAVQYKKNDTTYVQYQFLANPQIYGDGNLQRRICTPSLDNCSVSVWQSVTAPTSTLQITNMRFYVLGTVPADKKQPRVLITAEGVAGVKTSDKTDFTLQTSVSQRFFMNLLK